MDTSLFPLYLLNLRQKNGFKSQRKLALDAGISSATLSRIEAGTQKPQPETLEKLAPLLNVTYEELLEKAGYLPTSKETKSNSYGFETHELLSLEVEEAIKNNRLATAIMLAFQAMEARLGAVLFEALVISGHSSDEAFSYLTKDRNYPITTRISELFKEILHQDLTQEHDYLDWIDAVSLRNKTLHTQYNPNYTETTKAISSYRSLITSINRYLNEFKSYIKKLPVNSI